MKVITINRNILATYETDNYIYGTDGQTVYRQAMSTRKIKGTDDDYEIISVWRKVHWMSYEKMDVISNFRKMGYLTNK